MTRRRLSAVDDPLAFGEPSAAPSPRPPTARAAERTAALYVRLPIAESDLLARAAFELGVYKRELVAALISAHVDPHTEDGLAALRALVESQSQRAG
jgi:hypothetical protein